MSLIPLLTVVLAVMFVVAPVLIVGAPYESTMGLVQKIFYFHFPSWMAMFLAVFVAGGASVTFLVTRSQRADALAVAAAELAVVFGAIGLITGPLWGIKAWGVWWVWDPRGTSAFVLWLSSGPTCCCGGLAAPAPNGWRRRLRCSAWSTCRSCTGR